ncbi:MAG TPA: twin-arginine translocase subunit TatC [Spirochaetota bacterium]|nr:twin-arginine translocase subunit TatC [Spirochaetota bacterium]HPC41346.1 twin-arginine translocase subunit TatC [Spirochaetota bacterium]HPL15441.1 twin-arginine translocase subunit TatC [Spirochaetota bacterium]HQF09723.1 twin-arginine translocase subunit TatC [Spirochaetota bacterium]HQH99463.1 twin-arginine translocase subunit TatC [Spirochaetota bacterium]
MATSRKPRPVKAAEKKKQKTAPKKSAAKKSAPRNAPEQTPPVSSGSAAATPPPSPKVINPLTQISEAVKNNPILPEMAGLSTFERVIHFFARHDNSDKQVQKSESDEDPDEIDPEALERGDMPMSFVDHLDEIRSRILISIITFFVLTVAAFVFSDELLYVVNKPFIDTGLKLNVFKLAEGFMMRLKVAAIASFIVSLPFFIFQVWRFILPAITRRDRMFSRVALVSSVLLFYSGVAFVYFLLMPFTVKMLLSFVAKDITSVIGASEYISFVFLFCFFMGVIFEFPILVMILTRIGLITPYLLSNNRKWAIVVIFVLSAVVTPTTDILTQSLVAVPLYFLFEASIVVSKMTAIRKKKKELEE